MNELVRRVLDAYGGRDVWGKAARVRATVSADGFLFKTKRRPRLDRVVFEMDVVRVYARFRPIDQTDRFGVLDGHNARIEDADGAVIERRPNAWRHFGGLRHRLWWDALDMIYFAGYATWNYCLLPALLTRPGVAWEQFGHDRLMARFPATIPTHCPEQTFLIDPRTGLLKQHNYTAEVVGGWARAANVVLEHATNAAGIPYASKRRVTPLRKDGAPRDRPVLVAIDVHDYEVLN